MDRNVKDKVEGWDISLQRNVHMYCHALSVEKGQHKFSIDCEDLPTHEKTIGIWLYNSTIPETMIGELQKILLEWAGRFDIKFQIYKSKDEFITSNRSA
jgi:hypothetical protein